MILIPVKNLAHAKQRLSSVLSQPDRTALAQAMLSDIFEAVGGWTNRPAVAIVTSDPFATSLARQFDFELIPDGVNRGETDAIEKATSVCVARGMKSTLVIPGDIPLVRAWELERILEAVPMEGSVLSPAADGRGTNAVLRRPAALFPLKFGNDSFKPHLAAARASGKPCTILSFPGIALDVDSPADLRRLAETPGQTRAQALARQWDLAELPLAANE